MNEEEVKVRLVLPYLRSLGFDQSDLSLETTFSVRIGRSILAVAGACGSKTGTARGRLDILVKHDGLPLFVVEVKEQNSPLSDQDRDQAISYARLVHPIATYALVTNGQQWRLYESISKHEVEPGAVLAKNAYTVALPDEARNDALDSFLGYSTENLLLFCREQVAEQMRPLAGSPDDLTKKYIPELTVLRSDLMDALSRFETDESAGFLLLGASGCGKTSSLCAYASSRLNAGRPTLFFTGGALEADFLHALQDEFSWTFPEQLTPVALVRRIARVAKAVPVVIVLDAVDEWNYSHKAQSLLNFLRGSRNENVKVVLSCKSGAWDSIGRPLGSDLGFASYFFRERARSGDTSGFEIGPLPPREFSLAVRRYRDVFDVHGRFEDKVLGEARRSPFLLRVMFLVAAETDEKALTFSSRQFFERYYDIVKRKTGDPERADAQLIGVARSLSRRNTPAVEEADLRADISLSTAERLLPALFEHNILQRTPEGNVAFYFQQLRDFLIAFRVHRWSETTLEELGETVPTGIIGEALTFYLRFAPEAQMRAVAGPIFANAERYLALYTALRARHFPALFGELSPRTEGPVAFLGEFVVPTRRLDLYGFKTRMPEEGPVHLVPVERAFSDSNLVDLAGATSLHNSGSSDGFRTMDVVHEVTENELFSQLKDILKERRLPLRGCPKLSAEAVASAILSERHRFPELVAVDGSARYPWTTLDIRVAMRRGWLHDQFEQALIEQKRREGRIRESWHGDSVSYDSSLTAAEQHLVECQVEDAMRHGTEPKSLVIPLNLVRVEERLRRAGVYDADFEISGPPWVTERMLSSARADAPTLTAQLEEHLVVLMRAFLAEYARLVDFCFPTLKHTFDLRGRMPLRVLVKVDIERWSHRLGGVTTLYEKLPPGSENEVEAFAAADLIQQGRVVYCRGRRIDDVEGASSMLYPFIYRPGSNEPLHDLVYERIGRELPRALARLRGDLRSDAENRATETSP